MASTHAFPLPVGRASKDGQTLRYISLFSSFVVALSAGSNYGFSSYSPQLQERLHLTSTQINVVGAMGNMGVYLSGPLWGRLVDKRGPKVALLTGALLVLIGYGGLSATYEGTVSFGRPIIFLALFSLSTGLGNCAAFTAAMNAQAKSWSEERRGLCTALVLSGFGLSAFFYSSLSHTLYPGKTGDYLLLLALGSSLSFLLGFFLIKILPQEDGVHLPSHARRPSVSVAVGAAATADETDESHLVRPATYNRRRTSSDIGGRAWAFSDRAGLGDDGTPSESGAEEEGEEEERGVAARDHSGARGPARTEETQGLLQAVGHREEEEPVHGARHRGDKKKKAKAIDLVGWSLIKETDFIILFFIMTMISGTGLLVINNIGTMTRTLYEYSKKRPVKPSDMLAQLSDSLVSFDVEAYKKGDVQQLQAHQVSAISIGNACGRILIGLLSDVLVNQTGDPAHRVYLLLLVCSLALISQGLAATPNIVTDLKKLLGISSLTGLMYGTLFGLCPVLTFEWFGLRHFSQNWGIISLSPVLAGNIFNLLFGKVYDSHVPKDGPSHICPEGEECFRLVFKVTLLAAVLATVLSIILIFRRVGRPSWATL